MTETNQPKIRTITLTDSRPVKIRDEEWPVVAKGDANTDDSDGRGNPPNRQTKREIRVRQHADGRAIVYGVYLYSTQWQGESDASARRGELCGSGASTQTVIAAIRRVARGLAEAEGGDADWIGVAQECIGALPAETI